MGEKGKMFISDYQACLARKQGKATGESFSVLNGTRRKGPVSRDWGNLDASIGLNTANRHTVLW